MNHRFAPFLLLMLAFCLMGALAVRKAMAASDLFGFPVRCAPANLCFIYGYPDLDKAEGQARDYTCGAATRDGDPMLRIGLASISLVPAMIPVLAARDGIVRETLDGLEDLYLTDRSQLKKGTPECGNAVILSHARGVETAYCHLRQGSVRVQKGDYVQQGQVIGFVGQSGYALWPQLGFSIMTRGTFIDPASGLTTFEGCGVPRRPVFADIPPLLEAYAPLALIDMGLVLEMPDPANIRMGLAGYEKTVPNTTPQIFIWAQALRLMRGDRLTVSIHGPSGELIVRDVRTVMRTVDEFPVVFPAAPRGRTWEAGLYEARINLTRPAYRTRPTAETERRYRFKVVPAEALGADPRDPR